MVFGRFPRAGLIIIVIIVATILVDAASGWLRRRIIEGSGGARLSGQEFEEPDFAASGAGRVDTDAG
jgi:hypothetical protein